VVSLVGGAFVDRRDRRPVLAGAQVGVIAMAVALTVATEAGHPPPVALILVLGGILAGSSALDNVARGAIIPGILGPERLREAWPSTMGWDRRRRSSGRDWAVC
jgi:MFS family permease